MKSILSILLFILLGYSASAQDDLEQLLNNEMPEETNFTTATFKATRVLNGHSIERMKAGQLDFRIHHRFGLVNSGFKNFYGLDGANTHLGLEYGFTDWFMLGIGRGTYQKAFEGLSKFSILRQSSGKVNMPLSLSIFSSITIDSREWTKNRTNYFTSRLSYVHQILVARKFNDRLSLQLSPSFIHRNMVSTELEPNDLFACGFSGRYKLSNRISFNAEYYLLINAPNNHFETPIYHPLAIGFDIETGGHVFQLMLTNSEPITEKGFIGETYGSWLNGDIHFGFNISRVFTLK